MSTKYKGIFVVIVFLTLVILFGAFTKTLVDMKTPVEIRKPNPDAQISGFYIEFENVTTEPEVSTILESYNMTVNYTIDYNSDIMPKRYYIIVDKNKTTNVKDELRMEENWTKPAFVFLESRKGNYFIITVPEQIINDKSFHAILEKNHLQVKESVLCFIDLGDGFYSGILETDASRIETELKMNEKILFTIPEGKVGGFDIQFENGTTEPEVKTILEKYNMTLNYTIDYNIDYIDPKNYIIVDKDKITNARSELGKVKNWNEAEFVIRKGNNFIFMVYEEFVPDGNFHAIIEKNNLQMKNSVWCIINFENDSSNWILDRDAIGIKRELETNEKILTVETENMNY
jgi:hypothetical protein